MKKKVFIMYITETNISPTNYIKLGEKKYYYSTTYKFSLLLHKRLNEKYKENTVPEKVSTEVNYSKIPLPQNLRSVALSPVLTSSVAGGENRNSRQN